MMINPHSVTQNTRSITYTTHAHAALTETPTFDAPGFHICLHSLPPSHNFCQACSCRGHPLPRCDTAVVLCNVTLVWKEVSKQPQCLLRMPWRVWKSRLSEGKIIFICCKSIHLNCTKTSHRVNTLKHKLCWAHKPPRPDAMWPSQCCIQATGSVPDLSLQAFEEPANTICQLDLS